VFFLPYMMGDRTPYWNQNLTSSFVGISLNHTRADLIRSVFEGICYSLKDVLNVFLEFDEIDNLSITGGGAVSPFWNQMLSDVFNKKTQISEYPKQVTSLGAAHAVAVGLGIYKNYNEATKKMKFVKSFNPDKNRAEKYEMVYRKFNKLYDSAALQGKIISNI